MCVGLAVCAGGSVPIAPPPQPLPQGEGEMSAAATPPRAGGVFILAAPVHFANCRVQPPRMPMRCGRSWASNAYRMRSRTTRPSPCEQVDLAGGYAVLKDIVGNTQFLLIPTTRDQRHRKSRGSRAGCAELLAGRLAGASLCRGARASSPAARCDRAGDQFDSGRTQNQLHIHVDCMRLDVIAALREHASRHRHAMVEIPGAACRPRLYGDAPRSAGPRPASIRSTCSPMACQARAPIWAITRSSSLVRQDAASCCSPDMPRRPPATGAAGEQLQDHACAAATVAAR